MRIPAGVEWRTWRPVHAGLASRVEVARNWSLADVLDANAILDAFDDAEASASAAAKARR